MSTQLAPARRAGKALAGARIALDFALPTAGYYALRAAGASVYVALLAGALISAVSVGVSLLRGGRMDGMAAYMTTMMLGSLAVALVSGSTRFLLAREAFLTGVTGIWFLACTKTSRPLSYLFSKPLLEGRMRWPGDWEQLWARSSPFRHMWRVSSVMWGIGLLIDAALRVTMAYTLNPDAVPALGTALYVGTSVVLIAVTTIYYAASGIYDRTSILYR